MEIEDIKYNLIIRYQFIFYVLNFHFEILWAGQNVCLGQTLPSLARPGPTPPCPALPILVPLTLYFAKVLFPAQPCPALPCPALPCPALLGPALPSQARPSPALPCPALPCPALPCPALLGPALPSQAR